MKSSRLPLTKGFHVGAGNERSQAASMVVPVGGCEGGPDNRHRGADQWLYVISGRGEAIVNGRKTELSAGMAVLIERGDFHEIRNTGRTPLKTFNVYLPPAYTKAGDELPPGKA